MLFSPKRAKGILAGLYFRSGWGTRTHKNYQFSYNASSTYVDSFSFLLGRQKLSSTRSPYRLGNKPKAFYNNTTHDPEGYVVTLNFSSRTKRRR